MMRSSRANRLTADWRCPHCHQQIETKSFRLAPTDHTKIICPNRLCARMFTWKTQNKGKLWPEQRAYNVLR